MNNKKWEMYINGMQGHQSVCETFYNIDNMRFITSLIPPDKYNRVLDIGVGEGLETSILKQLGYNPIGIISGEDNIRWADEHYPDIEFIECDMHDLPFGNETFDAIYTNQVFEHCFAPFIMLLECYAVLKKGGMMYIKMPTFMDRTTPNDPTSIDASYISHHHPSMFSPNILKQMFEKTGFIVNMENHSEMSFLLQKGPLSFLHGDVARIIEKRNNL